MGKKFSLIITCMVMLWLPALSGCARSETARRSIVIPDLVGKTLEEAGNVLGQEGLRVGTVSEEYSDSLAAGLVLYSHPSPGEEAEEGSAVDLAVSKGPELVTVPDLVGEPESEAVAVLQAQGLVASVQRAYNESVSAGLVCGQNPSTGTQLKKGSAVTLTVSLGSAYVTCPACGGRGWVTVSETCPECGGSGECYT